MRYLFLLLTLLSAYAYAQDSTALVQHQTIMFWNVENAFWPEDDPLTADDDFTPNGIKRWTKGRLKQKLTQLEKGLLGAGGGQAPMVVGLAEIEGDSVLNYWTHKTPLYKLNYRYVLSDRSDRRGIRTALLYQPSEFRLIASHSYSIDLPEAEHTTRQILHASGRLVSADTLDLIICHLPSQYSGARQTQESRDVAQQTLMAIADSIAQTRETPHIIIMGDMNQEPNRKHAWWDASHSGTWVNLMLPLQQSLTKHPSQHGTHKYQGEWSFLDQFIVNSNFTAADSSSLRIGNARSFSLPFMLTDDVTHLGKRPKRSFYGSQYEGGTSDHLPILLDLEVYF